MQEKGTQSTYCMFLSCTYAFQSESSIWLNGCVFVYELSGCGFESSWRGKSRLKLLPFSGWAPKITSAQILKNMFLVSRSFKRFCVEHCFKFLENQSFMTIFFV